MWIFEIYNKYITNPEKYNSDDEQCNNINIVFSIDLE